jgi:hypothetical protein
MAKHESSITFKEAIEAGAKVAQVFATNEDRTDDEISIVEFENSHGCYLFTNGFAAFVDAEFETAVADYKKDALVELDEAGKVEVVGEIYFERGDENAA